jgi:hypothetical protein
LLTAANYANEAVGSLIRAADNGSNYVPHVALAGLIVATRQCLELALNDQDAIVSEGDEAIAALEAVRLA